MPYRAQGYLDGMASETGMWDSYSDPEAADVIVQYDFTTSVSSYSSQALLVLEATY